jgi:hypothetical protein
MTLSEYIVWKGIKAKDVAHDLRIDRRYVTLLIDGKNRPSFDLAERVAIWSKGHVMPNDWMIVDVKPARPPRDLVA